MLQVQSLSKQFVLHQLGEKCIEGFNDVSFNVPQGSSLGISGPSGSGKSSVLKCIFRTYTTSAGEIWFESDRFGHVNLSTASVSVVSCIREREIGMITQFLKVLPRISAIDLVAEPLLNSGLTREAALDCAAELLARLGIPSTLWDAFPVTFSGGEQQRVNIARAVIRSPRLLILDEPTASLDARTTEVVLEILEELRNKGCTMIGIFHQNDTLHKFSDVIYSMPLRRV